MAVCLECGEPMAQTEAICGECGADYRDTEESFGDIVFRQSSLSDLFRLMSVMAFFFAFLPITITAAPPALWPFALGILSGICVLMLGDCSELFARFFSLAGIVAFLFYPLVAFVFLLQWLLFAIGLV